MRNFFATQPTYLEYKIGPNPIYFLIFNIGGVNFLTIKLLAVCIIIAFSC